MGHEVFRTYAKRIDKMLSDECVYWRDKDTAVDTAAIQLHKDKMHNKKLFTVMLKFKKEIEIQSTFIK